MTTATSAQQSTATTWNIDPAHTLVEFSAKHMMITTVKGRFADVRGTLAINEDRPEASSVAVELAAASLDTRTEQRDEHLRSGDFLDAAKHPLITFRSRRIEGLRFAEGAEFRIIGDLTIRDVTREITLNATYEGRGRDPWGGERVSFSATGKLDRRDYGLTWNAALESGGVLVGNEIKIQIEAQAIRAA